MRKFISNEFGGIYGIVIFVMVLGLAAFIWLVFNTFLEFFINYMPNNATRDFFIMFWAHGGILLVVLLVSIFSLLVYMQKSKYMQRGGGGE